MAQPPDRQRPSPARIALSWLWALSPGISFGLVTAPVMVWAAIYRRSWLQGVLAAIYSVAMVVSFATSGAAYDDVAATTAGVLFSVSALTLFVGGLTHGLIARRWVFGLPRRSNGPEPALLAQQRAVLAASQELEQARAFARRIVEDDPKRAVQLRIGRVDIDRREFPDGGLIDVNNVHAEALQRATELSFEVIRTVTKVREEANGFGSYDDLLVLTELPPQTFDHVADLFVFPPRIPR